MMLKETKPFGRWEGSCASERGEQGDNQKIQSRSSFLPVPIVVGNVDRTVRVPTLSSIQDVTLPQIDGTIFDLKNFRHPSPQTNLRFRF